jgi:hypothetical protein
MDCRVKPGNDDRFNMIGSRARPRNSNHCCWPAVRTTLLSALHRSSRFRKENLRTARVRRKITIAAAAVRIGTGARAVMAAEKGKPSTGIAVDAALLWLYDLLEPLDGLADPARDREGLSLEQPRARARKGKALDREL